MRALHIIIWVPQGTKFLAHLRAQRLADPFTSWYDASHAIGFRVWFRFQLKITTSLLLCINLCIKPGLNMFSHISPSPTSLSCCTQSQCMYLGQWREYMYMYAKLLGPIQNGILSPWSVMVFGFQNWLKNTLVEPNL